MSDKPLTPRQCRLILIGYAIVSIAAFIFWEFLK